MRPTYERNAVGTGRGPQVRISVPGSRTICFECFPFPSRKLVIYEVRAVGGLRPSFSTHVRFRERGAPVQFLLRSVRSPTHAGLLSSKLCAAVMCVSQPGERSLP